MKYFFLKSKILLFLGLFLSTPNFAQLSIVGKWETKDIIGYTNVAEYSLLKEKAQNYYRSVEFNLDGSFSCGETMQCLTDCFVFTSGTYAMIDNDHVHLVVENIRFVGLTCGMKKVQREDSIKDLGVFYIYKEGDAIRLIPSTGDLQNDRDKMLYAQMLDSFVKEWKSYNYVWSNTDGNQPEEIVTDCKRNLVDLDNYKIVFSKNESYGNVFLLRENENYHYVVYNAVNRKVSLAYPKNKS
ncbi:hypothetical protein [Flavobacterium quisquiliarum]|uniref:Lipocalin-like domain-containing protein n=1 Tax=Flavobacterium quisquiliarum TaxID=1834436 RepID=A0ABV8WCK2_9FLAO|nr:hypothetical protein [Flavobacterium quisquiliarum]MBW1657814.1 hypothetical protein [Flavobacterium quisquiliarum]NWL04154.1 hypothetical protein [Flavobacterium collinsii]